MSYITCILVSDKSSKVLKIDWTLKTIYELLKCDTIDIITRYIGTKAFNIIVDDEGALIRDNFITGMCLDANEKLVGNIIVVGLPDSEGDSTNLSEKDIMKINKQLKGGLLFYSFERRSS